MVLEKKGKQTRVSALHNWYTAPYNIQMIKLPMGFNVMKNEFLTKYTVASLL